MKWPCHFFVNGEYLGEGWREGGWEKDPAAPPASYAYFCPRCGEVWARAHIEGEQYTVWAVTCTKHDATYRSVVPGSLWLPWDRHLTDSFPPKVMLREARLHLEHEKKFPVEEDWV